MHNCLIKTNIYFKYAWYICYLVNRKRRERERKSINVKLLANFWENKMYVFGSLLKGCDDAHGEMMISG